MKAIARRIGRPRTQSRTFKVLILAVRLLGYLMRKSESTAGQAGIGGRV